MPAIGHTKTPVTWLARQILLHDDMTFCRIRTVDLRVYRAKNRNCLDPDSHGHMQRASVIDNSPLALLQQSSQP